jgi:hypothetical protein
MNRDLLSVLPLPLVHAFEDGQSVTLRGTLVAATLSSTSASTSETLQSGLGAIQRWIALFDRAT